METIIFPDDELRYLETRFGAKVREMGAWNSDGVYGYLTIRMIVIERAAEALNTPSVTEAVSHLKRSSERTQVKLLCEMLDQHGHALIDNIVTAHRELWSPLIEWRLPQRTVAATH